MILKKQKDDNKFQGGCGERKYLFTASGVKIEYNHCGNKCRHYV